LCHRLAGTAPLGVKLVPTALMHALQEAKWVNCGRVMSSDYTTKKQLYAAPEMADLYTKSDLRRMVEDTPATSPPLQIVK
jgi:hypothetical protein